MDNSNKSNHVLKAGVAKSEITIDSPDVKVNDPLYAKVLVLSDGQTETAIIAMDTTAIGCRTISREILYDVADDFMPKLRSRLYEKLEIADKNVLVAASHTHPPGRILCDDDEQLKRIVDAVGRAKESMIPVKVGVGAGYEDRLTINRTFRLKNGQHWTMRTNTPTPPEEEVEDVGPIDPTIGILRIDRTDGQPLAVIYNFACHPLLKTPQGGVTADFPGFASKIIEENLGNGAMALFLQGAGGDISEVNNKDYNCPRNSEDFGTTLGLSTLKAIRDIATTKDADIQVISETIDLPLRTDFPEVIEKLQQEKKDLTESLHKSVSLNFKSFMTLYIKHLVSPQYPSDYSYRYLQAAKVGKNDLSAMDSENREEIQKYLSNIHIMEKLVRIQDNIRTLKKHQGITNQLNSKTIPAEVMGIKIGQFVLITSPAEVLVEIGLNIKENSPHKYTFITSDSNGYLHYSPPASYYDKGGYEVTECLLSPQWQEIYEKKAKEIINKL
jgi:hypothetical protein